MSDRTIEISDTVNAATAQTLEQSQGTPMKRQIIITKEMIEAIDDYIRAPVISAGMKKNFRTEYKHDGETWHVRAYDDELVTDYMPIAGSVWAQMLNQTRRESQFYERKAARINLD